MTTATEGRAEMLEGLRARRAELGRELTEAQAEVRHARDPFLAGRGDREPIMAGQLKANSLEEATRELDSRIEALEAEEARADRAEAYEARLAHLVDLDGQLSELWSEVEGERRALAERLAAGAERIADARQAIGQLKAAFLRAATALAPAFENRGGGDAGAQEIERAISLMKALEGRGATFAVLQTDLPAAGRPVGRTIVTAAHAQAADLGALGELVDHAVGEEEAARSRAAAQRERRRARQAGAP